MRGARAVMTVELTSMMTRFSGLTVLPSRHRCGPSLMSVTVPISGGLYNRPNPEMTEKLALRSQDQRARQIPTSL